jgi:ectoine hydroxylase-related dioxygenase (phytanoyl-CoA dioxygenase family)
MAATNFSGSISSAQQRQFESHGYFILERAIEEATLTKLRETAGRFVAEADAEMERRGVTTLGITHKNNRYFIGNKFQQSPELREFLFSDLMAGICRATLGDDAFLFYEQFVLKAAEKGMKFGWHQDSGYIGYPHRPYLTCWCALDDMSIENGTVSLLPYDLAGTRDWVPHTMEKGTNDKIGYHGSEEGIPVLVPAGSIAVFSSTVFHRSGTNITDQWRRVYLAQYSAEPILKQDGSGLWGQAVPFLRDGENIYDEAAFKAKE